MKQKVSIIGCSVAGLGTALELLKLDQSADVTIYDKKRCLGDRTICGGAVSCFMLQELDIKIPRYAVASEINTVRIHSPNSDFWELKSQNRPYGYILYRNLFEMHLADKISLKGGKFQLGCEITDLAYKGIIVGADGVNGISRKVLGLGIPKKDDIHLGIQLIGRNMSHPQDRIDLFFGSKFAPKGYAWIFPDGIENRVRIGLGVPLAIASNLNVYAALEKFMFHTQTEQIEPVNAKLIPTAKPPRKLVYNKVLLVGDAGLFCDPLTGGGIANALLSGKHAAKAIHKEDLKKYEHYCSYLKKRNSFRYKMKQVLCSLSDEDFNTLIHNVKDFHPKLTRISWAIIHALIELTLKNPKLTIRRKVLRKLLLP